MVIKLRAWSSSLVFQTSFPFDLFTATTTAGPQSPKISQFPATVGVDLDTVELTLRVKPGLLIPVKFCKFCFQIRDPSAALTA